MFNDQWLTYGMLLTLARLNLSEWDLQTLRLQKDMWGALRALSVGGWLIKGK